MVFPNYRQKAEGSIYDTVAIRDIFLQETTAHDPTTDHRTKRLFCSLACSKLQNSENRDNMNPNLKPPSLCTIPLILFPRVLVWNLGVLTTESFELANVQQASVYVA